ncbi:membrane protein [Salmonella enterica subsp. diarizonae]|uniref:Membrane protein n=1 Tax=Salmonella diarizonae TaxID=59204 RepID=A0A379U3Y9_SALDZ|nr:membrane protein [Salmonella enterica subsp. diarizonae]VFS81030.1 membrane protein [Salmonella enterica subsp. diarizonae]
MRLKIKEHITLWRNEGLIAYVTLGFLCTFFMEVKPYYHTIFSKVYFSKR